MTGELDPAELTGVPSAASTHREVNDITLHVVAAGDPDNPLVVFLHGFPEFWYGWRDYIAPFVDAGYRVLVPDQRGYNRSEKPSGTRAYRTAALTRDIADLVATEDRESAHIIGHDWGAAVAWELSLRHPEVVDRMGILNVPHTSVFQETLTSNLTQLRKSWYMFYFQLPRLPEWMLERTDHRFWHNTMREWAEPGTFTDEDMARYQAAWEREGATTAMINWYRALFRHGDDPSREQVAAPTLIVWGEADKALVSEMAPASLEYCDDGRLERFPDASHWVNHERRAAVTELLLDHVDG